MTTIPCKIYSTTLWYPYLVWNCNHKELMYVQQFKSSVTFIQINLLRCTVYTIQKTLTSLSASNVVSLQLASFALWFQLQTRRHLRAITLNFWIRSSFLHFYLALIFLLTYQFRICFILKKNSKNLFKEDFKILFFNIPNFFPFNTSDFFHIHFRTL